MNSQVHQRERVQKNRTRTVPVPIFDMDNGKGKEGIAKMNRCIHSSLVNNSEDSDMMDTSRDMVR